MTKEEIIEKYEEVLESREAQVIDLTMELGRIQERIITLEDTNERLEAENEKLKKMNSKKDFFLTQELQNKEIMFIRLQNKEQEVDDLRLKVP